MSLTVSTCFQICNSPLNLSQSKHLYSFPKSQRFKDIGKSNCEKFCYDLPPVKDHRKAGIGYGTKYDFTKQNNKTPGPNTYELPSETDAAVKKHKGFPFGVSRENMASTGIMGNLNKRNPGPGNYQLPRTLSTVSYSFRQRTSQNDPLNAHTKYVPGPGAYPITPSITPDGKYFESKFRSSGALSFNPARSKRFPEQNKGLQNPGPGQYPLNTGISKDGQYFVSGFKSSKCRSFAHDVRRTFSQDNLRGAPGPGQYRIPSEFGYYESAQKLTEQKPAESKE